VCACVCERASCRRSCPGSCPLAPSERVFSWFRWPVPRQAHWTTEQPSFSCTKSPGSLGHAGGHYARHSAGFRWGDVVFLVATSRCDPHHPPMDDVKAAAAEASLESPTSMRSGGLWKAVALLSVVLAAGAKRWGLLGGVLFRLQRQRRRLGGLLCVLAAVRLIAAPFFRLRAQVHTEIRAPQRAWCCPHLTLPADIAAVSTFAAWLYLRLQRSGGRPDQLVDGGQILRGSEMAHAVPGCTQEYGADDAPAAGGGDGAAQGHRGVSPPLPWFPLAPPLDTSPPHQINQLHTIVPNTTRNVACGDHQRAWCSRAQDEATSATSLMSSELQAITRWHQSVADRLSQAACQVEVIQPGRVWKLVTDGSDGAMLLRRDANGDTWIRKDRASTS
jgi:hypothetical protein